MREVTQVNTPVECGDREMSPPLLPGKCCRWSARYLARGCFNQISPFLVSRRDSGLQYLQSSVGLNTTSYVSLPLLVLFLIAVCVWDLEEFCFLLHVVASPER